MHLGSKNQSGGITINTINNYGSGGDDNNSPKKFWKYITVGSVASLLSILAYFGINPSCNKKEAAKSSEAVNVTSLEDVKFGNTSAAVLPHKKRTSGLYFTLVGVETLRSFEKIDTITPVTYPAQFYSKDFTPIYPDSFRLHKNRYYKELRLRLQVENHFNKSVFIHQINVLDTFATQFYYSSKVLAAGGKNPDSIELTLGFKEIPPLYRVGAYENDRILVSSYLKKSKYWEVKADTTYVVDLIVVTKDVKTFFVCRFFDNGGCKKVEEVNFPKNYSALEIVFVNPNRDDNRSEQPNRDTITFYARPSRTP